MKIFLWLLFSLLTIPVSQAKSTEAGRKPSANKISQLTCDVLKDWKLGSLDPIELCVKYKGGTYCPSVKTFGQSICLTHGKNFCLDVKSEGEGICVAVGGSFCGNMKSTASGICVAVGGSFCGTETDELKWNKRLSSECGW